jgi:hypothetical protein
MSTTVKWPRFLIASLLTAIFVAAVAMVWHGQIATSMYADYPSRPADQMRSLFPFLIVTFLVQIPIFCYMYLRVYQQRSMANAAKFGLWAGFFTMMPNGQFWVGTPGVGWDFLVMQLVQGVVTLILAMVLFQAIYRPADESWTAPPVDFARFLPWGLGGAVLVFALDLPFHQFLAPKLFTEYPASDYPHRMPDSAMLAELFGTYLYQLTCFCYLFLRIYPKRSMGSALWFGTWLGFWVLIPNAQIFVAEDKYTWHMLSIQFPEGMLLTIIMMAYFEMAYRPKASLRHATAE